MIVYQLRDSRHISNHTGSNDSETHLDERLDLASPCHLLFAHPLGYLPRVPLDTSNDGVGITSGPVLGLVILLVSTLVLLFVLLDNDDLFASLASSENDRDLGSRVHQFVMARSESVHVERSNLAGFVYYNTRKSIRLYSMESTSVPTYF